MTQYLTPTAKRMKAIRDKRMAMTAGRKARKAENQRLDRRDGTVGDNMDRHHDKSGVVKKVSIKNNRGNYGKGTKKES